MKIEQKFSVDYNYDVFFTRGVFERSNRLLSDVLRTNNPKKAVKVAVVLDKGVHESHPNLVNEINGYFSGLEGVTMTCEPLVVAGGEQSKNTTEEFFKSLALINEAKIDRHSFLMAIGGGAVLDMVGFAAAVGHRGVRHIRIPTTVLSQNDSGVGVKNGINFFGKKNFIGSFSPPFAVINDVQFLTTLNDRDWRSGISEAIKVALIKNAGFFEWLRDNVHLLIERDLEAMTKLIFECAQLHGDHISNGNDPFELGSSRPLDFGHWAAHKLEQLTHFDIKHGEAVAIGIALDVSYAREAGFLDQSTCNQILELIENFGFNLFHPLLLDPTSSKKINPELLHGLEEFREHLGGDLTITMIEKIGAKFDVHEINHEWMERAAISLMEAQNARHINSN